MKKKPKYYLHFVRLNYKCFLCPLQLQDRVGSLSVQALMLCFDRNPVEY